MVLWTAELDTLWLEELVAQTQLLGKRARSGYKKEAWVAALKKINKDRFPPFKMSQLKSRHDAIKGMYGVISSIINTSGMGWEASTCRVLCTDSTWDHFLAGKPPSYRVWKSSISSIRSLPTTIRRNSCNRKVRKCLGLSMQHIGQFK